MRQMLILATAAVLSASPALAQSSRTACDMVPSGMLEQSFGGLATLIERGDQDGVSFCNWQGGDEVYAKITSITAASQNIVGGTPLQYFAQSQAGMADNVGAENLAPLDGPWQAGFIIDPADNPSQAYSISFINQDDTVTVATFGLPRDKAVALAGAVAAGM
ncbi:hypothetical protein [Devosia sp. A449]